MSKLRCVKHQDRVLVIQTNNGENLKTVHRDDGSACDSAGVKIGGKVYEPWELELYSAAQNRHETTKEEELLHNVFGG